MAITETELASAEVRAKQAREGGYAVSARYNRQRGRVIVTLNTGVELTFPARMAQGLADADAAALSNIEITPSGLGLHWPQLDADLYVPGLMQGIFGSKAWMVREMGAVGGRVRTAAKAAAARENGKRGGRPRRNATG